MKKVKLKRRITFVVPKSVQETIDFWNNSGLHKHLNKKTKTFENIVVSLKRLQRGVFFTNALVENKYKSKKFTKEEITETIKRFSLAAINLDYEPIGSSYKEKLGNTSLLHFLYSPFAKTEKSLFLKYFDEPPKLLSDNVKLAKNERPRETNAIRNIFIRKVLGGIKPSSGRNTFSPAVENKFRLAGKLLFDFFDINKKILRNTSTNTVNDKVDFLFTALTERYNTLEPGHFCSKYTFENILPAYLKKQGIVDKTAGSSIYDT